LQLCIGHDLKDMRVAADEEARPVALQVFPHPGRVPSGISPYVDHVHAQVFAGPLELFGVGGADVLSIYIPVNAP
jgi:hypothetical protein